MTALDEIRDRDALKGDGRSGATMTQADADRRTLLRMLDTQTAVVALVAEGASAPRAEWTAAWTELTGYVRQARDDGEQIDPADLLAYMVELKRGAFAPVRDWMAEIGAGGAR